MTIERLASKGMQVRPPCGDFNDRVRQAERFGHQKPSEFQILPDHDRGPPGPSMSQHVGQRVLDGRTGKDHWHHVGGLIGVSETEQVSSSFPKHLIGLVSTDRKAGEPVRLDRGTGPGRAREGDLVPSRFERPGDTDQRMPVPRPSLARQQDADGGYLPLRNSAPCSRPSR